MVYSEKFVAVVVCDGKILRESRSNNESIVKLPFNSEYSIKLKNLNTTRALVSIEIDGQDVLDGKQIIVDANDDFDLKGFLKGYNATNAFRFIKKTQEISDHRGDKIDDGFIRITCQFEKQPEVITKTIVHENHVWNDYYHRWDWPYRPYGPYYGTSVRGSSIGGSSVGASASNDNIRATKSFCSTDSLGEVKTSGDFSKGLRSKPITEKQMERRELMMNDYVDDDLALDDGITVKGERVNQQFRYGSVGALEEAKQVIIIRLKGTDQKEQEITRPVFVRTKKECPTCGKKSESNVRFCGSCGTNIEDVN